MAKKATVKKTTAKKTAVPNQKAYVLNVLYALLRESGQQPLVASAMLNEISAGFSLADIGDAMKMFGDL